MSLTWDVAIIIAAADVKPAETGPDMKSIKKPEKKVQKKKNLGISHLKFSFLKI